MKYQYGLLGTTIALILGSPAFAYDYLLDPATMEIGAAVGENLVVKESCADPEKTNCPAGEKLQFISAKPGRTGRIELPVTLSGDFDVSVSADWNDANGVSWGESITLYTDNNHGLAINFVEEISGKIDFNSNNPQEDSFTRYQWIKETNWQKKTAVNDIRLSVQNGSATVYINDDPFQRDCCSSAEDHIPLEDPNQIYQRLVIAGIKDSDRLFEVKTRGLQTASCSSEEENSDNTASTDNFDAGKQAGIQQCVDNPNSCGITVSSGESVSSDSAHANYDPNAGELYIPFVDVPGIFGDIQTYEVYLTQQPLTFTFDLDMNRVAPR
ncbi:secreted protein [Beggiatoa sp. PS]|nr:secreted protein [Beggiatoa sp. PS]